MVRRVTVLAWLLVVLGVVSMFVLWEVFGTIFFAITVAYVLLPVQRWLLRRGLGPRVAAGLSTIVAFVTVILVVLPLGFVLYFRRSDLIGVVRELPDETVVEVGGMRYAIELVDLAPQVSDFAESLAVSIARAAPALAFKLFLFVLLVYALLLRPHDVSSALLRPVPREYYDVVMALHERLRSTLYAIYVLQAATALGTFLIAWVFFVLFGYDTAFSFAVISGILQFIPIIGPSVVVLAIGGFEVIVNANTVQALLVSGLGLFFIGFLPDALIRPQLASLTAKMPGSLYFVGFVGGVLSIGVVGVIAGPVVVGLLAEVGELLAEERKPHPKTE
jgi:predicted PurR-regulated permease PerM